MAANKFLAICANGIDFVSICSRRLSTSRPGDTKNSYKLVVVGGGAGGITTAAKLASKLGKGRVLVVEPSKDHYYQPLWTLVGGGLKTLRESRRDTASLIPSQADWLRERVVQFEPDDNLIYTDKGSKIEYDFLVVAVGLRLFFERIVGLDEALRTSPHVCSNYSWQTVGKTAACLRTFRGGNAIFTQPNVPIKCAGAPQKAAYLADAHFRKSGVRDQSRIVFNTGLASIFSVPVYATALRQVMRNKGIEANLAHNLVRVAPDRKEALFETTNRESIVFKYDMLHVTPPMGPPPELRKCSKLVNQDGFLTVDKSSLRHSTYSNVFGIGDCTDLPTSKTAAAVASQSGVLARNLSSAFDGKPSNAKYDGYTSCPLVTSFSTCILAEFDYALKPLETLPLDQSRERYVSFLLKKHFLAPIYWNLMLKGYWEGPSLIRKILHLEFK